MLHERITNQIIGAFFEIYRTRGYGFLESVYANSLAVEIGLRGLQVRREIPVQVDWKAVVVGTYRIDLLVEKAVLVEVKSVERTLLNFGPDPHFIRRVNTKDR